MLQVAPISLMFLPFVQEFLQIAEKKHLFLNLLSYADRESIRKNVVES